MESPPKEYSLYHVLNTAFDAAYLEVLEEGRVCLDDRLQAHLRALMVNQAYDLLEEDCMKKGIALINHKIEYFCEHGYPTILRLLDEQLVSPLPEEAFTQLSFTLTLLPALEPLDR